ncbi:MAG: FtsQ-type POTRA domain-containing protein [Clostridia bacterium]|nr:FtsQ-type POTRA domain-containing protein [Clostridia bacterium]
MNKEKEMHTVMEDGNGARVRRKKPNGLLVRLLRGAILAVGGVILLLSLLLVILPLFRVQKIYVEGNSYYTTEEILELSGIRVGDELLAVNGQAAADAIYGTGYFSDVTVSGRFPGTVRITVKEKTNVMYTEYRGNYYSFDESFTVLEASKDPEAFRGLLRVNLPEVAHLCVGAPILFATNLFDGDAMNMDYIHALADSLDKNGLLPYVTSVDCSQKYNVSFVLNDTFRLQVGKVSDMDAKLQLADRILAEKQSNGAAYVTLDVSNLQKSTYRVLDAEEFMAIIRR